MSVHNSSLHFCVNESLIKKMLIMRFHLNGNNFFSMQQSLYAQEISFLTQLLLISKLGFVHTYVFFVCQTNARRGAELNLLPAMHVLSDATRNTRTHFCLHPCRFWDFLLGAHQL
jgi:hypothetical protein